MKNTFLFVLIIIAFSAGMFTYWWNGNSNSSLIDIKEDIIKLMDTSSKEEYRNFIDVTEKVNLQLIRNRFITAEIRDFYQKKFLLVWKDKKLDSKTVQELKLKAVKDIQPLIAGTKLLKYNQLLYIFIDIAIVAFFLSLAVYSNLLRDVVGDSTVIENQKVANLRINEKEEVWPAFSLSRVQIAVWITIIASLYLHAVLWNQCRFDVIINTTALVLMGISAGTLVTGAMMDTVEIEQGVPRTQDWPSSGNFFKDILRDNNGISMHRFQNVVWTVIAIIVYFYRYNTGPAGSCLPELDSTLLALTGISSATYLTLKARENKPGTEVIKEVKIRLVPDATLDAARNTAITNTNLATAVVTVKDGSGSTSVLAVSASINTNDFVINNVKPGVYSITVKWEGKINNVDTVLAGMFNGKIDTPATPAIIPIVQVPIK